MSQENKFLDVLVGFVDFPSYFTCEGWEIRKDEELQGSEWHMKTVKTDRRRLMD